MGKFFQGKVALITGSASGIGRITAQAFAREGANVVVTTGSNIKGAEETVRLIQAAGGEASFIQCDVSKAREVEALIAKTVEHYGSLDFAFNNAGVGPDGVRIPFVSLAECPEDIWDRTINTNLKGVWLCLKYEMQQMLKQKSGAIVNTSSVGTVKFDPGFGAYAASKTGVIALTKTAAVECAASGIRINAICPGPTAHTGLSENTSNTNPEGHDKIAQRIPMGRLTQPEEIAAAVLWLCSKDASFITGNALSVDGGFTLI
ncbi:MAG: short-chain dehydrogenase/reductase [Firmicutes bacterium]|nr:short-chain dehydrogenase/reductase [Bacillota bacterium]